MIVFIENIVVYNIKPGFYNRDQQSLTDHCLMGIHKESSLNLRVNLKFLVNTHKTSISKIFCDSIAKSGLKAG